MLWEKKVILEDLNFTKPISIMSSHMEHEFQQRFAEAFRKCTDVIIEGLIAYHTSLISTKQDELRITNGKLTRILGQFPDLPSVTSESEFRDKLRVS